MEKDTRGDIERVTQKARRLLEHDFTEQLAGIFGVLQNGHIDEIANGKLDEKQQVQRKVILAALSHKRASGMQPASAVTDYLRDAAFTTLNRFVALKMLERRGLVQECISKGEGSSGFVEITSFAPGLKLPDINGYQLYIESLFDELSTEVKVLFDRREPAGVLWPRRLAFDSLLELLNAVEMKLVWDQDETIGWVYQYFNSGEERRAMRDASQTPRNSRELAVRNQFFTPNYVVRFLVDNTLGRIWYDMRRGDTRLAQQCEYMVRQPNETFTGEGVAVQPDEIAGSSSHDEAWQRPIQVTYRSKKDPRAIRIVDPACGSGHFLLGAFDLLVTIYNEAWSDPESPVFADTGQTIREDYPTESSLSDAMPGLILRYNLHGVDIDPRCGQIAQLALWMRTQRAFADNAVARLDRPPILRTNIVVAEPMPGDQEHFNGFVRELTDDRLEVLLRRVLRIDPATRVRLTKAMADTLKGLFEAMWDGLCMAGEMGLLTRIEMHLSRAIERGRAEWESQMPLLRMTEFEMEVAGHPASGRQSNKTEVSVFWNLAERVVYQILQEYASIASSAARRLFVEDAVQGFALADIASKRFDVVLMNPPFGACANTAKASLDLNYPNSKNDIYAAFVERGVEMLVPSGRLGAITSRTGFFLSSFQKWREIVLLRGTSLEIFADLGAGVLDSAMVETAAYALQKVQ